MAKVESRKGLLTAAAVVGGDFQAGDIAFLDGAEEAAVEGKLVEG